MDTRVDAVLRLLKNRPSSIESLAQSTGLSASRLEHLFKFETGECLSKARRREILLQAAGLLRNPGMQVKAVAFTCGYSHVPS
ncbi:MAG: helix-turn-helix domain-containing protein, partial [Acidobacteria bacterium]